MKLSRKDKPKSNSMSFIFLNRTSVERERVVNKPAHLDHWWGLISQSNTATLLQLQFNIY